MVRRLLYWFAVLVVSVALVVALVLVLAGRDRSSIGATGVANVVLALF